MDGYNEKILALLVLSGVFTKKQLSEFLEWEKSIPDRKWQTSWSDFVDSVQDFKKEKGYSK